MTRWVEITRLREAFLWALPAYVLAIGTEIALSIKRRDGRYGTRDTFANLGVAIGTTLAAATWGPVVFALNSLAFELTPLRVPVTWWSTLVVFVLSDLCYYASHRAGHRVGLLWAAHSTHHTSRKLNLTVGLRNPWTSGFHDWIFWWPLPLCGFDPVQLVEVQTISLIYQFFQHTEAVGDLGPLGLIFNTPSHHRVHHGTNPEYLDRNYGGVLIVWDRLFGTFAPERARPIYGALRPVDSANPFVVALSGWWRLAVDVVRAPRSALRTILGPP